jgi:nucleoid-associated protein YgaU
MADTKLTLGDFTFEEFEIPDRIPLGGEQALVVHKLPGGARVVQSMGRDDAPISWSGLMLGPDSLDRARQLDLMRAQGLPLQFQFFGFNYQVKIKSFVPSIERFYRVPFTIELMVVVDNTQGQPQPGEDSADTTIRADTATAVTLADQVGDDQVSAAVDQLNTSVGAVPDFSQASPAALAPVSASANAVLAQATITSDGDDVTVASVDTVGGVATGYPVSTSAPAFQAQLAATQRLPVLASLMSVVGRISANVALLGPNTSARRVTQAGGSLFKLAEQEYGDASRWSAIAQANNLTDPVLTGVQTLDIPQNPADAGGVFTQ